MTMREPSGRSLNCVIGKEILQDVNDVGNVFVSGDLQVTKEFVIGNLLVLAAREGEPLLQSWLRQQERLGRGLHMLVAEESYMIPQESGEKFLPEFSIAEEILFSDRVPELFGEFISLQFDDAVLAGDEDFPSGTCGRGNPCSSM
jgi:hypothetical protein